MGNCHYSIDCLVPLPKDLNAEEQIVLRYFSFHLFTAAIKNCIAISAGVPLNDVIVGHLINFPQGQGLNVAYSIRDSSKPRSVANNRCDIDNSILNGKFTSLLHKHGFQSAAATTRICVVGMTLDSEISEGRESILQYTQKVDGLNLVPLRLSKYPRRLSEPMPDFHVKSCIKVTNRRKNMITTKGCNGLPSPARRNIWVVIPAVDSRSDTKLTTDYSSPAFQIAVQQSAAIAAGVPVKDVSIVSIDSYQKGTNIEVVYNVIRHLSNSSILTCKIDDAASCGSFISSLRDDGYSSLTAASTTTVMQASYTIKQTLSVDTLPPQSESHGGSNLIEKLIEQQSMTAQHEARLIAKRVTDSYMKESHEDFQAGIHLQIVNDKLLDTRKVAVTSLSNIQVKLEADANRECKEGKPLLDIVTPIDEIPPAKRPEIILNLEPVERKLILRRPESEVEVEVEVEDRLLPMLREEKRLLTFSKENCLVQSDSDFQFRNQAYEKLLRIEELHQIRENMKVVVASAAKLKVDEIFRDKKESGRMHARAVMIKRDMEADARNIRLENSKKTFDRMRRSPRSSTSHKVRGINTHRRKKGSDVESTTCKSDKEEYDAFDLFPNEGESKEQGDFGFDSTPYTSYDRLKLNCTQRRR